MTATGPGIFTKVLSMKPYKDPDEFVKNMGADAFRERIAQAQNSFLFEVDVLKRDFQLDDPEQKTKFYHGVAEKLLEFGEALERDNFIHAVSQAQGIPYEDLRRLVNQLGARLIGRPRSAAYGGRREAGKKKEKEDGIRKPQRLLLTWLIERPVLFDKIDGIIGVDDFIEPLYRQVAEMVFAGHKQGKVNPAEILNHFIQDEEQYKEVAALFHARLEESLDSGGQNKAFSEVVYRVKKNSLDYASRNAADIGELQKIIREQAALKTLSITID